MANEFAEGAKSDIRKLKVNKPIDIEVYKESADVASSNCSGIMWVF